MKRFYLLCLLFSALSTVHAQTDITFCVDMTSVSGSTDFAAQAIAFDFNSFNSGSTPLTDTGNNIFCGTFSLATGEVRFNFFYAAAGGAGGPENLTPLTGQSCVNDGEGGIKRTFTVFSGQSQTLFFVWETCDGTMPADLTAFSGQTMAKHNRLFWTTASEKNVQWHILERSDSGRNNWEEVARTQGARLGTEEQGYTLDDEAPLTIAYYRLRFLDYDGTEGISPILMLEREDDGLAIKAYPNPSKGLVEVSLQNREAGPTQLSVFAADGRAVLATNYPLSAGLNTISLDLTSVPAGVYFLRVGEQVLRVVRE